MIVGETIPSTSRHQFYRHAQGCGKYTAVAGGGSRQELEMAKAVVAGRLPEKRFPFRKAKAAYCYGCRGWRRATEFRWAESEMVPSTNQIDPLVPSYKQAWNDGGPLVP